MYTLILSKHMCSLLIFELWLSIFLCSINMSINVFICINISNIYLCKMCICVFSIFIIFFFFFFLVTCCIVANNAILIFDRNCCIQNVGWNYLPDNINNAHWKCRWMWSGTGISGVKCPYFLVIFWSFLFIFGNGLSTFIIKLLYNVQCIPFTLAKVIKFIDISLFDILLKWHQEKH